jgi:hypothetical protein
MSPVEPGKCVSTRRHKGTKHGKGIRGLWCISLEALLRAFVPSCGTRSGGRFGGPALAFVLIRVFAAASRRLFAVTVDRELLTVNLFSDPGDHEI